MQFASFPSFSFKPPIEPLADNIIDSNTISDTSEIIDTSEVDIKERREKRKDSRKSKHKDKKRKREEKEAKKLKKLKKEREDIRKQDELSRIHLKEDPRQFNFFESDIFPSTHGPCVKDRKGDRLNIHFGMLLKGVPAYNRLHYCLGMEKGYKVKWWREKNKELFDIVKINDKKKHTRYSSSSSKMRSLLLSEGIKVKRLPLNTADPGDYIHISFQEESTPTNTQSEIEQTLMKKNTELLDLSYKFPKNIKTWLELINFQDEYSKLTHSGGSSIKSILEMKIDIYKKAIEKNPGSEELVLGYLQCCEQLYDNERMMQLWKSCMGKYYESYILWRVYLMFIKSNFATFSIDVFRKAYISALTALNKVKLMYKNTDRYQKAEMGALKIALYAIIAESQAGYRERAMSMLQALIEIRFYCPETLLSDSTSRDTFLGLFQVFWESQVPRFGEKGSEGWKSWHAKVTQKVSNISSIIEDYDIDKPTVDYSDEELEAIELESLEDERENTDIPITLNEWLLKERKDDSIYFISERDFKIESDDDLERTVLYEDIKGFIFQYTHPSLDKVLVEFFLRYIGAKFALPSTNSEEYLTYIQDSLECTDNLFELLESMNYPNFMSESTDQEILTHSRWDVIDINCVTVEIDNEKKLEFAENSIVMFSQIESIKEDASLYLLLNRVLNQIRIIQKDEELENEPSTDSLFLQVDLARFKQMQGQYDEARDIYNQILLSMDTDHILDYCVVYFDFVMMELNLNTSRNFILNILVALPEGNYSPVLLSECKKFPATKVLKAKKLYKDILGSIMNGRISDTTHIRYFTLCFAIFECYSTGLMSSANIYDTLLPYVKEMYPTLHEQLTVDYLNIIMKEYTNKNCKEIIQPSFLRNVVKNAVEIYPNNTVILSTLLVAYQKSLIAADLRLLFDGMILKNAPKCSIVWLFAIRSERHKGSANRIRGLFERGFKASESVRHNIAMWLYYLDFEIKVGDYNTAKGIFFRAIHQLPWCKRVWLHWIDKMQSVINSDELTEIFKLMQEKELRLRNLPPL